MNTIDEAAVYASLDALTEVEANIATGVKPRTAIADDRVALALVKLASVGRDAWDSLQVLDRILGGDPDPTTGVDLIAAERQRQITKGYTTAHDRQHGLDELLAAAESYIRNLPFGVPWPMTAGDAARFLEQRPAERLAKAGALIAAALDLINQTAIQEDSR